MSSLKRFFKDTILYGIASVLPRLINFALMAVYTSVFSTTQFSVQTTWYVYAAFCNVVLTMGMETAFFRYYSRYPEKNDVISTTFLMLLLTSSIFLGFGLLYAKNLAQIFQFSDTLYIKLLVWTTFFDTLVVIPFAYLRVQGKPVSFLILKLANVLFLVFVNVFLLIVIPMLLKIGSQIPHYIGFGKDYTPSVVHIFIANIAASVFTFLCLLPQITKIKWHWNHKLAKILFAYGWPIMIGGLAYVINENADKLMLSKINPHDNGIYSACYKLGVFMTLYITAFRLGAEPFFFNQASSADAKEKYSKIMTWFVIFGCLFMLGVVVFIDVFAVIFIRQKVYLQGLYIVPIILLANLFSGIYNNLSIWYKLTDKTRFGMVISIFGAMITLLSLWILLPAYGILGGALSTLITYVCMAYISWYLGGKYYPIKYELHKILVIITTSSLLCGISFLYFRNNFIFSLLALLFYIFFIITFNKKDIALLFSKSQNNTIS